MLLFSLPILTASAIIAVAFLIASTRLGRVIEATGRADGRFRVFYVENETFPENPIPHDLHFLMSFTDYIEVDSHFFAQFSEDVTVYYTYVSSKRFVIRYMATVDGNLNPIVFQNEIALGSFQGTSVSDSLHISGQDTNGSWGTYVITPREHIDIYLDFVAAQMQQMHQESIITQNLRGFSAELFVNFEYGVSIPEWGVYETVTQGYRIPLSNEVYFFAYTGTPTFSSIINLSVPPVQPTLLMVVAYAMFLGLGVYLLFAGIKGLKANPNPRNQKALEIREKYANEIVISDAPLSLNGFTLVRVEDFDALLRLAINLNKHIMCFQNDDYTEFAVIVDSYANYYSIDYDTNGGEGSDTIPAPKPVGTTADV